MLDQEPPASPPAPPLRGDEPFERARRRILRERTARLEAERLLEEKAAELYRANADLGQELARVSALLDGAPYSILSVEPDLRIGGTYSESLPALLGLDDARIAGASAPELFGDSLGLSAEGVSSMRQTLQACLDEDMLNWVLNRQHLPQEATIGGETPRVLELLWSPLVDWREGVVTAVLGCLRDVTAERQMVARLEACDRSHSELLEALGVLLKWPRSRIFAFFRETEPQIDALEAAFGGREADRDALLIDMHSLKAAARAFQFEELAEALHALETALLARPRLAAAIADPATRACWSASHKAYAVLRRARDRVLVGDDNERAAVLTALLSPYLEEARDALREEGAELSAVVDDRVGRVSRMSASALDVAFRHLIPNMVDHSLLPALAAGALAAPRLAFELAPGPDGRVALAMRDNGRGFDLPVIRRRAEAAGLAVDPTAPLAVIFEPGFSTAAAASRRSGRGVGMGGVKKALEAVGGEIRLHAPAGGGTDVTLLLPA